MTIILQYNSSEKNKIEKDLTDKATVTAVFKYPVDIVNPEITVTLSATLTLEVILSSNYITISSVLGRDRMYFITSVDIDSSSVVRIHLHEDVLETFKDEIYQQKAIVQRNATDYSLLLNDGSMITKQNPHIVVRPFSGGFTGSSYVLAVAGNQ